MVSIPGSSVLFIIEISNSYEKSSSPRTPLTSKFIFIFFKKPTISPSQTATVMFFLSFTSSFIIEARSSTEKRYFFCLFSATTTTSSSKIEAARRIILICPDVGGSKDPGKAALIIISAYRWNKNWSRALRILINN